MGCSMYAVLQKKDSSGKFETIDTDLLYLPSSGAREFNSFMGEHMKSGLPSGFTKESDGTVYYKDMFFGEHSFGSITLDAFCKVAVPRNDRISIDTDEYGYRTIQIDPPYEGLYDTITALQHAFDVLYHDNLSQYRLVVGYSS